MANRYLAHYGVKGMKWDVRKKEDEIYEKKLALKQRKEEQRAAYKTMTTSQRKVAKAKDAAENEERKADLQARQEELEELTNKLVEAYDRIRMQKINTQRAMDRAALIIKKFKIKKAAII